MTDVLVRDVPDDLLAYLKERAATNRRSLQQEVLTILESAALEDTNRLTALQIADVIRSRLQSTGRDFGDSAQAIREDRER